MRSAPSVNNPRPVLAIACAVALAAVCAYAQEATATEARLFEGTGHAAEFPSNLEWLNAPGPLSLRQLRGKFVLLDFWTYCCINCMHLVPDLRQLEEKYARELVVIGVHSAKFENEKQSSQILDAIVRYGVRHPVVNDNALEIWKLYSIEGWPTVVLINPEGKIIGRLSDEHVFGSLDPVLAKAVPYFTRKGTLKPGAISWPLAETRRPDTLLSYPGKISADPGSHHLFVSDSNHNRILILDAAGRLLDTIGSGSPGAANGAFEQAQFRHPQGTVFADGRLYIADTENHTVRVADLTSRTLTTVLGTRIQARSAIAAGKGTSVALNSPWDLAIAAGKLYIAMAGSHQLSVADISTWELRPFAGSGMEGLTNGSALSAALAQPSGLALGSDTLYFADSESSAIRSIGLTADAKVNTIIGKGLFDFGDVDGASGKARLQHPLGIAFHDGVLYVADTYNSKIKQIDPDRRSIVTLVGAVFNEPSGLAWLDGKLYIADTNNHQVRILDPATKAVTSLPISGLDNLVTRQIKRFSGRIVDLGEKQVDPSGPKLAVDMSLPAGYKLNPAAPFFLQWETIDAGGNQSSPQLVKREGAEPGFPVDLRLPALPGPAAIAIQTVVYYCTDASSTCYVDPVEVRVKLVPAKDAAPASIRISVKEPRR